jgi:hypothetical protein
VVYLRGDIAGIKSLVAKAPNLSSLTFYKAEDQLLQIYNAVAEYQTYPVFFQNQSLRILPPMDKSSQPTTDLKDMADLLKVVGGRIEIVELKGDALEDSAVAGFAKAIECSSRLKELSLRAIERNLSDQSIQDLASIVARSELRRFYINLEKEEERVQILESIQWEHLRELEIIVGRRGFETRLMRTLIDGAKKLPGRPPLEEFKFYNGIGLQQVPLSMPEGRLLPAFLSSTVLKVLRLGVSLTLEEMLSLLNRMDLSRMESLYLQPKDFDSVQVDALLDCLEQATELRFISLWSNDITDDKIKRMEARGVQLSNRW